MQSQGRQQGRSWGGDRTAEAGVGAMEERNLEPRIQEAFRNPFSKGMHSSQSLQKEDSPADPF